MRMRKQLVDTRLLDDLARVHHDHSRRRLGDDSKVVEGDGVVSLELDDAARLDPARRLDQAQDGESGDGFSAARLADDPDSLPGADAEGDAIYRPRDTGFGIEPGAQIPDRQQGLGH